MPNDTQTEPPPSALPEIASLWIGDRLSWLEQLCLKSFADAGHPTTLYSYSPIENLPDGVMAGDAAEIYPAEPMLRHVRTGSPAIHADMWRLHLLAKTDKIWVDADMYCYRPFDPKDGYLFGWEKPGLVCNAVLALPRDSATLRALLSFFEDEYAIAPWLKKWQRRELEEERDAGKPVHITEQNWGFTGPAAVTYFLQQTGEIAHARPEAAFYPISFPNRNQMILSRFRVETSLTEETRGVHFWARRMKPRLEEAEKNRPRRGSFMHGLLPKHGIDPAAAPIPRKKKPRRTRAEISALQEKLRADARDLGLSRDQLSRKYLVEKSFITEALAHQQTAANPDDPLLANYLHELHFLQTVHVGAFAAQGRIFVYMKNHKAACRSVLATLMTHQLDFLGEPAGALDTGKLHKPPRALMLNGKRSLTVDTALAALRNPDRFRFTVLRDPVARTVAAYVDRIVPGHRQKEALMRHLGRDPEDDLSLSAFLDVLAQDPQARDLDRHWRSQRKEISYDQVDYDFIGLTTDLEAAMQAVARACFGTATSRLQETRTQVGPETDITDLCAGLSAEDRRNLDRAFADDFDMYTRVQQTRTAS